MVISCVVRLIPEQLSLGRFVGQVEDVATGEVSTIHDLDELAAALKRSGDNPKDASDGAEQ